MSLVVLGWPRLHLAREVSPVVLAGAAAIVLAVLAVSGSAVVAIGICAAVVAFGLVAMAWGTSGLVIALVLASLLAFPTVALGTAVFPPAMGIAPLLLGVGIWESRRRGISLRAPHTGPYLWLVVFAVASVAASWVFWDPAVATGSALGFGHRSLEYQATGLYLLAFPLIAYAAGSICSRLVDVRHLFTGIIAGLTVLTLISFSTWISHPVNPIQAFSLDQRDQVDYEWAVLLFVLSFSLVMFARGRTLRLIAITLLGVAALTAALQYVLAAWLAIFGAVMVMLWLRFRTRGAVLMLGALAIGALLAEPAVATIVAQRSTSPDVDRLKLWESALLIWTKSPVFGIGTGNLVGYMERFSLFPLGLVMQGYQQAHNIFLEILAEEGVIGLGLLFWFVAAVVRTLKSSRALPVTQSWVPTASLGMVVAVAAMASVGAGFVPTIASAGYTEVPKTLVEWFVVGYGVAVVARAGGRVATRQELACAS